MLKVSFDGPNKIIQVLDLVDSLEFKTDVYSAWKNWCAEGDNLKYVQAIRTVGGDPLIGGNSLGITFFLENGWRLRPYPRDHTLSISGNVYTTEGETPFVPVIGTYSVSVIMTVSNLSDSRVLENEISQNLDYMGIVYVDSNSLTSGTIYPYGTINNPVNNIIDALTICDRIGSKMISFKGNLILDRNLMDFNFVGVGNEAMITLSGCDVDDCEFRSTILTGGYTGYIRAFRCNIVDISNLTGDFSNCSFSGNIQCGDDEVSMHLCFTRNNNMQSTVFDFSECNYGILNCLGYTGTLFISGLNSADAFIKFEFLSGKVTLTSDNTAGDLEIRGDVVLKNNSTLVVNDEGIMNRKLIQDDVWSKDPATVQENTMGSYILKKLLTTAKFLGLK